MRCGARIIAHFHKFISTVLCEEQEHEQEINKSEDKKNNYQVKLQWTRKEDITIQETNMANLGASRDSQREYCEAGGRNLAQVAPEPFVK